MASKYVLFVDEVNKEFGKLLEMIKELEKGKADYIQSWKDLKLLVSGSTDRQGVWVQENLSMIYLSMLIA